MSIQKRKGLYQPNYWALYFTMSQVHLLDTIKKYEKQQFTQIPSSLPSTASNSVDSGNTTFFKILNMSQIPNDQSCSFIRKRDVLGTPNPKTNVGKDLNISTSLHNYKKINSKSKYQSKPVEIASDFDSVLTPYEKEVFRSKMKTQNWILPHDLHLLIRILKNIINQMDKQEQGLEIVNTDIRLLFYLDFKPVKGKDVVLKREIVKSKLECNPETRCECTVPSFLNNREKNISEKEKILKLTPENHSLQNVSSNSTMTSSRSVSIHSTNTVEQFHLVLDFAWKLFIMKVVKQLNTRIRKEALYSTLRTVTAYAVSSVQKHEPKMLFLPIPRTIIKNESALSLKMRLTEKLDIYKNDDNKSILSIHASISNSNHKQIRRKEGNSLMKLFLKHFKPKDVMLENVKQSISVKKLVSPPPSLSSVTSTDGTKDTGSTLPSVDSTEKEIFDLVQDKTPQTNFSIQDVPKINSNSTKTKSPNISPLQELTGTDFIATSSVEPLPDLNKLSNNRHRVEEPIQPSQSASDRSNYYLDATSARADTKKKLEEIEKKSSVFYEILSYVYDKILSRKSSKNESNVTLPLKSRAPSKLNFPSVKPSGDSQTMMQQIKEGPPLEKEIKTSYGRLLLSTSNVHSKTNFGTIPPTKNEIKNKVLGQTTIVSKRQPKKRLKNRQEKSNKKAKKLSKNVPDKQEEPSEKEKHTVVEINVKKNNSSSSLKTSSSIVTDECVFSPVSIVCGPRPNVYSSVSSRTSVFSSSKSNGSRRNSPSIELKENIEKPLSKYICQPEDKIISKEARHLKISVSQNTSFSCLRKRYRQKLFQCSENRKKCKCLDEQKLKELLRIILKEIDAEKEKNKAIRNLKKEEQKMTSSTSTHSLELIVTRSKCTQSSKSDIFDNLVSASLILDSKRLPSAFTQTELQTLMDSRFSNSRKFVKFSPTCNDPMKECVVYHVPTLDENAKRKAPETNSVLEDVPLINLQDKQLMKTTTIWDDCYEKDVNMEDKLSKLKLSEFTLIFNLLTVRKNKHKLQKQFMDVVVSETETYNSNIENDMRSSSDYSGNFSLMPVYVQRTKGILKKKEKNSSKGNEDDTSLKPKRRLSNSYYNYDDVQNKKSFTEFRKNYFQPKKIAKNGHVPQTFKIQKVSNHSFTSGTGNGRSLMRENFENSLGKVTETIKESSRLVPSHQIFMDDALKPNNVENTFRAGVDKSVHIQLPIAYYNSSNPQGSLKTSTDSKNKHVTWNLLHLPY